MSDFPLGLTTKPISQPVDYGRPKATIGQFHQEVIMGYQIEGFFEVMIYDISLISLADSRGNVSLSIKRKGEKWIRLTTGPLA